MHSFVILDRSALGAYLRGLSSAVHAARLAFEREDGRPVTARPNYELLVATIARRLETDPATVRRCYTAHRPGLAVLATLLGVSPDLLKAHGATRPVRPAATLRADTGRSLWCAVSLLNAHAPGFRWWHHRTEEGRTAVTALVELRMLALRPPLALPAASGRQVIPFAPRPASVAEERPRLALAAAKLSRGQPADLSTIPADQWLEVPPDLARQLGEYAIPNLLHTSDRGGRRFVLRLSD